MWILKHFETIVGIPTLFMDFGPSPWLLMGKTIYTTNGKFSMGN